MSITAIIAATLLTTAPWQTFKCRDGEKPWTFSAPDADVVEGGWVTMDFTAGWRDIVKERPFYAWCGVVFAAKAEDPNGKRLHLKTVNLGDGDRDEKPGRMRFLLPKGSRKFTISFGPQFAKGSFSLKGVTVSLNAVDPSHPSIEHKGRRYEYDERGKPPANPAKLPAGAAFGLFRIDSPRMTFDRFAPEQSAMTNRFSVVAAPGEVANLFVGAYASRDGARSARPGRFAASGGEWHYTTGTLRLRMFSYKINIRLPLTFESADCKIYVYLCALTRLQRRFLHEKDHQRKAVRHFDSEEGRRV